VGKDLPSAIGAWYAAHGYAFLGISDMNTYTWASEYGDRAHPAVPTVDATYPFAEVLAVGMDRWQPANDLQGAIDLDRASWRLAGAGRARLHGQTPKSRGAAGDPRPLRSRNL
jgi:hypothetical protein